MPKRKCKGCGERFDRELKGSVIRSTMFFHNKECLIDYTIKNKAVLIEKGKKARVKEFNKLHAKKKRDLKLNDKSYRLKQAQLYFNKFIRLRDALEPCISCQRHHEGQYHAGHYKTAGGFPELRFEPLNCHKQCSACNNHLSGNITEYRINLINKIGLAKVEWLEGHHQPKKYTCEQLLEIENFYKEKVKAAN